MRNLIIFFVFTLSAIHTKAFMLSQTKMNSICRSNSLSNLKMGLFDFLSPKPKPTASARHILVKGPEAKTFLEDLKPKLMSSSNIEQAFAEAASEYSTCPSKQKGGALGTFKKGMMVPAFDKVVFTEAVGEIHGPVMTPFGYHLILIQEREDVSA